MHGLRFQPTSLILNTYSDSHWVGDHQDRKSTIDYCGFFWVVTSFRGQLIKM